MPAASPNASEVRKSTKDRALRRTERELTPEQTFEVIRATEHAVLSTADEDGNPYGVPVTPVLIDGALYFHSTGRAGGRKEDNLLMNPRVSLCFIGKAMTVPNLYTVDFASAVVTGRASKVTDEKERERIMRAIVARLAPQNSKARNDIQFANRFALAAVWKVEIEKATGKARAAKAWVAGRSLEEPAPMPVQKWLVGAPD